MNKWYCLTIVWKTGEVQTLWSVDWALVYRLRLQFRGNEEVERCFVSRNGNPNGGKK